MSTPENPPSQPPLSEAVEQAAAQARYGIDNLERFAQQEATALAAGEYGLSELATAPVRLFAVLLQNAVRTASTVSDNLALLSLTGRFGAGDSARAFRVHVDPAVFGPAAAPGPLHLTNLVGELTGYRIVGRDGRIVVGSLGADGLVTITVQCAGVPSDIYVGRLFTLPRRLGGEPQEIRVAIDEIGVPVT